MATSSWSLNGLPGRVGPITGNDGGSAQLRLAKDGSLIVKGGVSGYQESAYRRNVYFASNQAGIASTAGLSSASLVFTLYNPAGSGYNLILLETIVSITLQTALSTTASVNVFWAGNLSPNQAAPATTTALTVNSAMVNGVSGVGKCFTTATLAATPVAIRPLCSTDQLTAAGVGNLVVKDDVGGALIVQPGVYISIQASAGTLAIQASATWAEELI